MSDQKQHTKVSLEDLLRLKRAERPDEQFWVKFDASLRHKQLSAIIQPRSRWPLFELLTQKRSYFLASAGAGALAVFAVAVSLRHSAGEQLRSAQPALADSHVHTVVAPVVEAVALQVSKPVMLEPVVEKPSLPVAVNSAVVASSSVEVSRSVADTTVPESVLVQVIQTPARLSDPTAVTGQDLFQSPSLVSGELTNRQVANSPSEVAPEAKVEPVFTAASVNDSRKARLLVSVEQTSANGRSLNNPRLARGRERIGSSISDESIYDSIHRLGLNGDRLSIRF